MNTCGAGIIVIQTLKEFLIQPQYQVISRIIIQLLIIFLINSISYCQIKIDFIDSVFTVKKDELSVIKVNYVLHNLSIKTILIKNAVKVVGFGSLKTRLMKIESDSLYGGFGYTILDEHNNEIIYNSLISEIDFPICFDFADFNLHGYQRDYIKLIDKNGVLEFKKKRYYVEKFYKRNSLSISPKNAVEGVFYFPIQDGFLKNKTYFIQSYYFNFKDKNNTNILNGLHLFNKIKIILED